ncbi:MULTISPECIES: hypothetical protein [unclassified Corallococcus]|nr:MULTISPECIES: hypothetical protein [unclassified Corallococcus]WAS83773.1 hypothetical protein O0N60_31260 [Corallococcus sp. NCRR]
MSWKSANIAIPLWVNTDDRTSKLPLDASNSLLSPMLFPLRRHSVMRKFA